MKKALIIIGITASAVTTGIILFQKCRKKKHYSPIMMYTDFLSENNNGNDLTDLF